MLPLALLRVLINMNGEKMGNLFAGATGNTITATSFGIYEARVLRGTIWSDWSRIPVNIHVTPPTKAPPIYHKIR